MYNIRLFLNFSVKHNSHIFHIKHYRTCILHRLFAVSIRTLCVNSNCKWKVVFYGTDEFSVVTLKALNLNRLSGIESTVEALDVVCIDANCAVKRYAKESDLNIYYWPYIIPKGMYDVGVVVSFGHLIQTKSILACKYGMINAHPSLLPRWRGSSPLIHSLLYGDKETGVTIVEVSPKKFDAGRILAQQLYDISPKENIISLFKVLADKAAKMVLNTLEDLPNALAQSYPQSTIGITNAPKLKPEVGNIDWTNDTSVSIDRKFRAFSGFIKIFTYWKNIKITLRNHVALEEIKDAKIDTLINIDVEPGFCYYHKKRKILYIKCKDGWIGITNLSVSKGHKINAHDFYNGYISQVQTFERYFRNKKVVNKTI